MSNGRREDNIRRIIEMEDRIAQCSRCKELLYCVRKPSMGKGELEPDVVLVFEYDGVLSRDMNRIVQLRNLIKQELKMEKLYHTYLVRCQPKACVSRHGVGCYSDTKLLSKDYKCLLTSRTCDGIPIKPGSAEIIACLPFLLEEIDILQPRYVILFGNRVSEFVLKSFGIFEEVQCGVKYRKDDITFLTTVDELAFDWEEARRLVQRISA